jgi:signal transduction histidine kinase
MEETALKILIVDDDIGDVHQIKRAIEKSGLFANCAEAVSAEQALKLCESDAFDLAIIDYLLPGEDGLETLATLAQRHAFMSLVMATGQGDEIVATEAMKSGAADYIRKSDIYPVSIRRVIEKAVERGKLKRKIAEQQEERAIFADVLVHDLRAPTSSIQTFVWDIQDALRAGDMESANQRCEWAVKAAGRMDTLIATLDQYTLVDGAVAFAPVDMGMALDDALANLHSIILKSHAVVTHDALPFVTGSASQLEQMLQNILGNGIKYCKEPVPRIHIAARQSEGAMCLFSVADNGIGIPEKDYKRVFEAFTRLHGADDYEGAGLGLATCRKIVSRHGGTIWCESAEGRGTTIFFTLQAASSTAIPVTASQTLAA